MPRAVQCGATETVHINYEGISTTPCGNLPNRAAPQVINRFQMCKSCFGRDRGLSNWKANMLGLERIVE